MDIEQSLERWAREGLITSEQRIAIEAFEQDRSRDGGSGAPLAVEVLTYLGVVAVLGAIFALFSDVWEDLGTGGRVTLLALVSTGTGIAGNALRDEGSGALRRAASVLWFVSVAFLSMVGVTVAVEVDSDRARDVLMLVGGPAFVLSVVYQRFEQRALQLLAFVTSAALVVIGMADLVPPHLTPTSGGVAVALLGAVLLAAARAGALKPSDMAEILGAALMLGGLWIPTFEQAGEWAEVLGIAACVGVLWASVAIRSTEMLFAGTVSLFAFITGAVVRHFADSLGAPLALLIVGGLLIGAAVMLARLRPLTQD